MGSRVACSRHSAATTCVLLAASCILASAAVPSEVATLSSVAKASNAPADLSRQYLPLSYTEVLDAVQELANGESHYPSNGTNAHKDVAAAGSNEDAIALAGFAAAAADGSDVMVVMSAGGGHQRDPPPLGSELEVVVIQARELIANDKPWMCKLDNGTSTECESPVLRIHGATVAEPDFLPALLVSGTMHGNERIGAVATLETGRFLVDRARDTPYVRWLLANRDLWLAPFFNAYGYAGDVRDDLGLDPNRDFPYTNSHCFQTYTARLLDAVVHQRVFYAGITFHGGMRSLTYNWGSNNHAKLDGFTGMKHRSTEPPDFVAQADLARSMQLAAGVFPKLGDPTQEADDAVKFMQSLDARIPLQDHERGAVMLPTDPLATSAPLYWFYPVAPTNDLVYPVNGGLEDWSYGGGWEDSPQTIGPCNRTLWDRAPNEDDPHLHFPFFLAEADDKKHAEAKSYGAEGEVTQLTSTAGHISRNVRMVLKLAEMLRPELVYFVEWGTGLDGAVGASDPVWTNLTWYGQEVQWQAAVRDDSNAAAVTEAGILQLFAANNGRRSRWHSNDPFRLGEAFDFTLRTAAGITIPENAERLEAWIFPAGCSTYQMISVIMVNPDGEHEVAQLKGIAPCGSISGMDGLKPRGLHLSAALPVRPKPGSLLRFRGLFDQQWKKQKDPDPIVPPTSHVTRIRIVKDYDIESWGAGGIHETALQSFPRILTTGSPKLLRADFPIYVDASMRRRVRRTIPVAVAVLLCRTIGETREQTECALNCHVCSKIVKDFGKGFNVTLFARRSLVSKQHKLKPTLHDLGVPLATFPVKDGVFSLRLAQPLINMEGLVVSAVAMFDSVGLPMSQGTLGAVQPEANSIAVESSPSKSHRRLSSDQSLICFFPSSEALTFHSPSRLRLLKQLTEDSFESTGFPVTEALATSAGYLIISQGGKRVQGTLCPSKTVNRATAETENASVVAVEKPLYITSVNRCADQIRAHRKTATFLNPFAGRAFYVNQGLSSFNCSSGDSFFVEGLGLSCSLATVFDEGRAIDPFSTDITRQGTRDITSRLLLGSAAANFPSFSDAAFHEFLHDAICTRGTMAPPLHARSFSFGQRLILSILATVLAALGCLHMSKACADQFPTFCRSPLSRDTWLSPRGRLAISGTSPVVSPDGMTSSIWSGWRSRWWRLVARGPFARGPVSPSKTNVEEASNLGVAGGSEKSQEPLSGIPPFSTCVTTESGVAESLGTV